MRKQAIAALGDFYGGLSGKTKDDFVKGNSKYISYMNVYIHPSVELDNCDYVEITENESQNNIQYGDILFTGSSETADDCGMSSVVTKEPNEPIYLNSFCFGLRFKELKDKEPSFYKHYFRSYPIRKQISAIAFGVTRFNLSKKEFGKIQIVVPDLVTQKRIASQLDTFTTLIAKLESELTLRQKQYEFYREELYGDLWTIAEKENNKGLIQIKSFSEIGDIIRGKRFVRDDIKEQGQPCIHYGDMYTYYGVSATETKTFLDYDFPKTMRYAEKGDVVIVGAGENNSDIGVGVAWLGDEKAAVHDACYILKHALDAKYVSHYLRTNIYHQQLKKYVSEGKICSFSGEGLGKVLLPVPFQAESYRQQQIVSQLDTFEQLIAALKREIALRRKQYEFYREKLLTFE